MESDSKSAEEDTKYEDTDKEGQTAIMEGNHFNSVEARQETDRLPSAERNGNLPYVYRSLLHLSSGPFALSRQRFIKRHAYS